jgi:hypothetical protein
MKNIVLLSDGTGNSSAKLFKTNVWRLYQALDLSDPAVQIAYYDDGVGTSALKPLAVLGGAFGYGLKRNVLDLYTFLCRHYEPGDRIYCFGFSRGAFTIRVLTGVINNQGLVEAETESERRRLAAQAFSEYRKIYRSLYSRLQDRVQKRRKFGNHTPEIEFVGLWDTVAAYGLPFEELTRAFDAVFALSVPERSPCPIVKRACHALALDDERKTFHPVLWNEAGLDPKKQQITQVWFSGVHSDVGGGYPEDSLAHVSLDWMIGEARRHDLRFHASALERLKEGISPVGRMHDSRAALGAGYRYLPRKLEALCNDIRDPSDQVIIERPKIHESVFRRIRGAPDSYAPLVLPERYAVVDGQGAILNPAELQPAAETKAQARERAAKQASIWDLVSLRRFLYFGTTLAGLVLAAFPLLFPAAGQCNAAWCWPIQGLAGLLPDFVAPWIAAFQSHPATFYVATGALVLLMFLGGRVKAAIHDRMRAAWRGKPVPSTPGYMKLLGRAYEPVPRAIGHAMVPVAGAAAVVIGAALVAQVAFSVGNSFGLVCEGTKGRELADGRGRALRLSASDVCLATGVSVREGVSYQVSLVLDDPQQWKRADARIGLQGAAEEPARLWALIPFRRHIRQSWFVPIARVGADGADEYPLRSADVFIRQAPDKQLVAQFTARRSGELFLFVNDAVVPWLYAYNTGVAAVSVQPVEVFRERREPGEPRPPGGASIR